MFSFIIEGQDEKWPIIKKYILLSSPKPIDSQLSDKDWVGVVILRLIKEEVRRGKSIEEIASYHDVVKDIVTIRSES